MLGITYQFFLRGRNVNNNRIWKDLHSVTYFETPFHQFLKRP